jgi:hypothetical protein
VGSPALSCGSGGTKSTGGVRAAGESAGGDGSAGPARPVSGSSSDSSGPVPPKLSPQAVVTVGHCKSLLQLSDDANVGRSQVSTIPHQDTPSPGLPAAYPLFRGGKTPVTVPMFDYGRKSHTYLLGIHNASGSDIWFHLEGGKLA